MPTNKTATGCVKILKGLGIDYSIIAETVGASIATIKSIACGRRHGEMYLADLQAAVQQAEQAILVAS